MLTPQLSRMVIRLLPTIIFICLFVIGSMTTVHAAEPQVQTVGSAHTVKHQTNALMGLAKRYQHATNGNKEALLYEMIELVEQRRQSMTTLLKTNPGAVLQLAIPAKVAAQLPAQVHSYLESRQTIEGTLEVQYADYENYGTLLHTLITDFDERIPLHFKNHPPKLQSGNKVRIEGVEVQVDHAMSVEMAVESGVNDILVLELGSDSTDIGGPAQLSNTFGEQPTLVLLINFQDIPTQPYTVAEADQLVFNTTSDFYLENSDGRTWLNGETHGWFQLPLNSTASTTDIADAADAAAQSAGIDVSTFSRKIYIFPRVASYGWSGLGTVGGTPSRSWINGSMTLKTVGHELGHNLGLFHSGSLECGDSILSDEGQVSVYGDTHDIMANKSAGHFNAFQKERLGWLDANVNEISVVQTSGTFEIETFETSRGTTPKALRVLKDIDPVTGDKSWFYLEYRQNVGFDDFLTGNSNVLNGLIIHMANEADPRSSVLLDMTPNSDPYYDWWDPALEFGQTFTEPQSGLTISSENGNGTTAAISVSFGQSVCVQASPTIKVTPGESQWVAPGTAVTYTVTVVNNDSAECSSSDFDVDTTVPTGWNASSNLSTLSIAPGSNAVAQFEVISSSSAADGFYPIDISAHNNGSSSYTATESVNYVVSTPIANQAPNAISDPTIISAKLAVTIAVTANDNDPDGDLLNITSVSQGAKGTVTINSDNTVTYTPEKRFKSTDSFTYTISDGIDSATAQVTITLNLPSDDSSDNSPPIKKPKKK